MSTSLEIDEYILVKYISDMNMNYIRERYEIFVSLISIVEWELKEERERNRS